ncbi:phage tail tip fiber protein [Endozoicomonas ascidiicola]|uniref:phage tail tip fiber protein n=1 Tax=Endozoicomonas ascidiicola TaxID=1698521 RepID=UPI0012FE4C53|nr:hypothetical protein [Endozoicomonas ascidiicola]
MQSLAESVAIRAGQQGNPLDRAVTLRELYDAGVVNVPQISQGGASGSTDFEGTASETVFDNLTPPDSPELLETFANPRSVILTWNKTPQSIVAHTEIYRSLDDQLDNAILIGVTPGQSFADTNVESESTYYYWVRYVSYAAQPSAYHSLVGVSATVPLISGSELEDINVDKLVGNKAAFVEANINEGSITNAKIGQEISSDNFSPTNAGWRINKQGQAEFNDIYARGDIEASSLKAGSANIIDTLMLQDNAVTFPLGFSSGSHVGVSTSWKTVATFNLPEMNSKAMVSAYCYIEAYTRDAGYTGSFSAGFRFLHNGSVINSTGIYNGHQGASAQGWTVNIFQSGLVVLGFIDAPAVGTITLQARCYRGTVKGSSAIVLGIKK